MATRTFTNGGVDNLWSTAGNWDTPPVDDDTVVIAAGQTCEYDVDTSAWANGIAGLTITGTLKISRVTSSYMKIKTGTYIRGAGTFNVGESAALAIPFAVKCTITNTGTGYIYGGDGLTMTVYAAEPAIQYARLTGNEAIGSTVLEVDTDVTGDIWADGDTVHVCPPYAVNATEVRIIAAGGIAAGAITITAGLTAAKNANSMLVLMSRNVKLIGNAGHLMQNFQSGKLTIGGGQFYNSTTAIRTIESCAGVTVSGGTFGVGHSFVSNNTNLTVTGGVICTGQYGIYSTVGGAISGGVFCGMNSICVTNSVGLTFSGGLYTCTFWGLVAGGSVVSGGTFNYNVYHLGGFLGEVIGGTFSNSSSGGIYQSQVTIKNVSFSSNTYDIQRTKFTAFNSLFGSATEVQEYANMAREIYSESIDHDQVAGAFKAWTRGGITSSQAVTVPVGYTKAMQTVLASATSEGFWQKEYTVGAGASVNITMNLRKSAAMAYLPRCIIFNKASTDPFAGGAGINTFTMTDSIDTWEASTYTYYNSTAEDVTLVVRFQGMNASGNMFSALLVEQINVDLTAVLAALAVVDANVDAILVDTGTDIPASIITIDGIVDDILLDTGTTIPATITTIDGIVDDILVDTGTTLPATLTTIDGIVDDILVDTDVTIPGLIAALDTDSILAATVEGVYTVQDVLKFMAGVLAGKSSGGGTGTITFRDLSDTLDRIVATVDVDGNRTAMTRNDG